MPDIKPLIGYILEQVREQDGRIGKTALVKLVYLADLEHYRTYGRRITDLHWMFYHYGPYAVELESAINDNIFVRVFGQRQTGYRFSTSAERGEIQRRFNDEYDSATRRTVDRIVEEWGLEPLNILLDYVYFETEPMQDVERGQSLDFSTVERVDRTVNASVHLTFPDGFLADLRAQRDQRRKAPGSELEVPNDEITDEAYQIMAEEEKPSLDLPYRASLREADRSEES